jgi:hypothetical protein
LNFVEVVAGAKIRVCCFIAFGSLFISLPLKLVKHEQGSQTASEDSQRTYRQTRVQGCTAIPEKSTDVG